MNNGLTETEKKEKRALEKKLSEMEEELKVRLMNITSRPTDCGCCNHHIEYQACLSAALYEQRT